MGGAAGLERDGACREEEAGEILKLVCSQNVLQGDDGSEKRSQTTKTAKQTREKAK